MIPEDWTIEEQKAALDELRGAVFREPRWFPFARWAIQIGGLASIALCSLGERSVHTPAIVYVVAGFAVGAAWQAQQLRRFEENWFFMAQTDRNILLRKALEERVQRVHAS